MHNMHCPLCANEDTRVVDSRPIESGSVIRRRRECEHCRNRFTTYERPHAVRFVRKRDGRLEPFMTEKLRRGVESAITDRPVGADAVDEMVESIDRDLSIEGMEVDSDHVGRMVLERLRLLDEVASVRFASVYKEFQGRDDFEKELAELEAVTRPD